MEVYTEIYAQVKGAEKLTAFTDQYDQRIDSVMKEVEAIKEEREKARYDEIVTEASEKLADAESKVIFGGRLGEYKYYDMDQVIAAVLDKCASELGEA